MAAPARNPSNEAIQAYTMDHFPNDATVTKEGQRLIAEIPILQTLAKKGIISPQHRFNSISANRTDAQQKALAAQFNGLPRYTSGAYKFATGSPPADTQVTYHGNVDGKGIEGICSGGLRGYTKESYTVQTGTSYVGHTLVSPSWRLALECYGFEYIRPNAGYRYRIALQVRVKKSAHIVKQIDTFNAAGFDPVVDRSTMEWSVTAKDTVIAGVVVKMYSSQHDLGRLDRHNANPFRKKRMQKK